MQNADCKPLFPKVETVKFREGDFLKKIDLQDLDLDLDLKEKLK